MSSLHLHLQTGSGPPSLTHSPISSPSGRRLSRSSSRLSIFAATPQPSPTSSPSHSLSALLSFFSLYTHTLPPSVLTSHSLTPSTPLTLPSTSPTLLYHLLAHLSPPFFPPLPHSPSTTLPLLLSSIHSSLSPHSPHPITLPPTPPSSSSPSHPLFLLSLSLLSALYGPLREDVVEAIMGLAEGEQVALMTVINDWEARVGMARGGAMGGVDEEDEGVASSEGSAAGSAVVSPRESGRMEAEWQAVKARLEGALREREKEVEALRREVADGREVAREREEEVRAELHKALVERTAQLERALADARRADVGKHVRTLEAELQAARDQAVDAAGRLLAVQREGERAQKERAEAVEELRGVRDELLLCRQRLDDAVQLKQQLSRARQRLELQAELKAQYAQLEEECRDKAERLARMDKGEEELRLARQREREWREAAQLLQLQITEAQLREQRAEAEAAEAKAELRTLREEQRRQSEESGEWDEKEGTTTRSIAQSISETSAPLHRGSVLLLERGVEEGDEGREEEEMEEERKEDVGRMKADADAEREGRVKAEAMVLELSRRWEESRAALRRMRVRQAEYELLLREVDRVRVEDELMAVREQAVMSSAVYGLAEEVARRMVAEKQRLVKGPPADEERKQQLSPSTPHGTAEPARTVDEGGHG